MADSGSGGEEGGGCSAATTERADPAGACFCWGSGGSGLLCQGDTEDYISPRRCESLDGAEAVATGGCHVLAVVGGVLVAAGDDEHGQLGRGQHASSVGSEDKEREGSCHSITRPVKVDVSALSGESVVSVACGWRHSAAVTTTGRLYTWGFGKAGALGHGSLDTVRKPTLVRELDACVVGVACGYTHTLVVDSGGSVRGCGSDMHGQLLQTPEVFVSGPQRAGSTYPCFLGVHLGEATRVHRVWCGWQHSLALAIDGKLLAWGSNKHGQCGVDATKFTTASGRVKNLPTKAVVVPMPAPVCDASVGWHHAVALCESGQLLTWGKGGHGQLGSGKFENSVSPTVIRTFSSDDAALRVACGSESTMAVCKDSLYVWGWNEHGNLGTGDYTNRAEPVKLVGTLVNRVAAAGAAVFAFTADSRSATSAP